VIFVGLVNSKLTANSVEYVGLLDESVVLIPDELNKYSINDVCEVVRSREIDLVFQLSSDSDFNVELHKALAGIHNRKVGTTRSFLKSRDKEMLLYR
jgi:hypothetical protein